MNDDRKEGTMRVSVSEVCLILIAVASVIASFKGWGWL